MDEVDPPVRLDPHEPRLLCSRQLVQVDHCGVRTGARGHPKQRVARPRWERADARLHKRIEAPRYRQQCRAGGVRAAVEQARDLQCVQGIAGRGLRDPHERRTRKRPAEHVGEDAMQRRHRQRTELEQLDTLEAKQRRVLRLL